METISFMVSSLIINLIPGNDVLFIASQSLSMNMRNGITAALGINFGVLFHLLASVLGLSTLLINYPWALSAIKWGGAAYLLFLAFSSFRQKECRLTPGELTTDRFLKLFLRAAMTNILNPKVALFFLAFLPQFVHIGERSVSSQTLMLGGYFLISSLIVNIGYTLFFGIFREKVQKNLGYQKYINKCAGMVLFALSIKILLS